MKYIRTKEGIYELMPNIEQDYEVSFDNKTLEPAYYTIDTDWIAKKDVIAQADTIEELGDTYVIVPKDGKSKPYTVNTLSVFDDFEDVLKHNDIYLSIWVDALLKPVAKMNDKGELELL